MNVWVRLFVEENNQVDQAQTCGSAYFFFSEEQDYVFARKPDLLILFTRRFKLFCFA